MGYFWAALISVWFVAAVYLYANYAVFFRTFGTGKKEKSSREKDSKWERVNVLAQDDVILSGKLLTAEFGESKKSVVLCHGFRSNGEKDFKKESVLYQKANFNVLLIEQRAHQNSKGKISTYGVWESYDIVYWCKWLELRFGTGCEILIHGKGMGGFAAMGAGANSELPQNVSALIVSGVYDSVFSEFSKIANKKYGAFSKMIIPTVNMFCRLLAGFDMRDFDMKRLSKRVTLPVLFQKESNYQVVENTKNKVLNKTLNDFLKDRGLV